MPHDDIVMPGYPTYRVGEQEELDLGQPKQEELDLVPTKVKCANRGCDNMLGPTDGHYVVVLHVRVCSNECYQATCRQRGPSPLICIGNCKICPHCDG